MQFDEVHRVRLNSEYPALGIAAGVQSDTSKARQALGSARSIQEKQSLQDRLVRKKDTPGSALKLLLQLSVVGDSCGE